MKRTASFEKSLSVRPDSAPCARPALRGRLAVLLVAAAGAVGCYFPPAEAGRSMVHASASTREGVDFMPRPLDAGAGTIVLDPRGAPEKCRSLRILGICVKAPRSAPPAPSAAPVSAPTRNWAGGI